MLTREPYELACPNCGSREWERLVSTFNAQFKAPIYGSYHGDSSKPFENFTVQNIHVTDEKTGKKKKLVVNSLAELRAAEKKHHFSLDIANQDKPHDDTPPTNAEWAGNIAADYDWKWSRDPQARAKSMASPIVTVDVGVAANESETLAGKMRAGKVA